MSNLTKRLRLVIILIKRHEIYYHPYRTVNFYNDHIVISKLLVLVFIWFRYFFASVFVKGELDNDYFDNFDKKFKEKIINIFLNLKVNCVSNITKFKRYLILHQKFLYLDHTIFI